MGEDTTPKRGQAASKMISGGLFCLLAALIVWGLDGPLLLAVAFVAVAVGLLFPGLIGYAVNR